MNGTLNYTKIGYDIDFASKVLAGLKEKYKGLSIDIGHRKSVIEYLTAPAPYGPGIEKTQLKSLQKFLVDGLWFGKNMSAFDLQLIVDSVQYSRARNILTILKSAVSGKKNFASYLYLEGGPAYQLIDMHDPAVSLAIARGLYERWNKLKRLPGPNPFDELIHANTTRVRYSGNIECKMLGQLTWNDFVLEVGRILTGKTSHVLVPLEFVHFFLDSIMEHGAEVQRTLYKVIGEEKSELLYPDYRVLMVSNPGKDDSLIEKALDVLSFTYGFEVDPKSREYLVQGNKRRFSEKSYLSSVFETPLPVFRLDRCLNEETVHGLIGSTVEILIDERWVGGELLSIHGCENESAFVFESTAGTSRYARYKHPDIKAYLPEGGYNNMEIKENV